MEELHLTNVSREADRTTRALRALAQRGFERTGRQNDQSARQTANDSAGSSDVGSQFVMNYAIWRVFGTTELAQELQFQVWSDWGHLKREVVSAAMRLWSRKVPCFTDAYSPAKIFRSAESKIRDRDSEDSELQAVEFYNKFVETRLKPLWGKRSLIAEIAQSTRSWKQTTQELMKVKWCGGTGFAAKEVVQDLLHTPLFMDQAVGGSQ